MLENRKETIEPESVARRLGSGIVFSNLFDFSKILDFGKIFLQIWNLEFGMQNKDQRFLICEVFIKSCSDFQLNFALFTSKIGIR